MNTDRILQSTLLDIVFENRNKDYGAYQLRKFYNNRLYKALGMVFMLVIVLCLLSFLQPHTKSLPTVFYDGPEFKSPPIDKPAEKKPDPPKQPSTAAAPKQNTQAFATPIIAPDSHVATHIATLDSTQISTQTVTGKPGAVVTPVDPGKPIIPGGGGEPASVIPAVDVNRPVVFAEVMPSYPGGPEALRKFLEKNLQNPQDLDAGQNVSVKIRFVVGYDGKLKGFETTEDGGAAFNNEVIRVLKKMPEWIPGKTQGQNVSVYYVLPVKFVSTE